MPQHEQHSLIETASEPFRLPDRQVLGCYLVRLHPAGNLADNLITLAEGDTHIGRDPDCDIEVADDFISRHHATIMVAGGGVSVVDEGSRNGTFVNDERIQQRRVSAGDHIRVGNHVFKFLSSDHPEAQYHEAVYELMTSDALTGIANRRFFEDSFQRELSRCRRHQRPVGVLMLDVDHFKRINDLYGHLVGDECLRELCDRVQGVLHPDDLFGRVGGEEFVLVLSEASLTECRETAERIRDAVAQAPFGSARKLTIPLTVSIGIAHSADGAVENMADFQSNADAQLYRAKRAGRDRIRGPE